MTRLSGILILEKPRGESSRATLNRLNRSVRAFHQKQFVALQNAGDVEALQAFQSRNAPKVGHAGTLDPMAEGVLLAAVGEGTKLIEAIQLLPKRYTSTFRLGIISDTEDAEGTLQHLLEPSVPTFDALQHAALQLTGRIMQRPPAYSALKVAGKRAYELARAGQNVELQPREIDVFRLDILKYQYPTLTLAIECGSGTYVRSLGRDLAELLGTGAIMTALTRDWIGPYHRKDAVLPSIFDDCESFAWLPHLLPIETAVAHLPRIDLTPEQANCVKNGVKMAFTEVNFDGDTHKQFAAFDHNNKLVSLLEIENMTFPKVKKNIL